MASIQWDTMYGLVVYLVSIPLYIYGFVKWYQWREDCLFRLRYSNEAFVQIALCLILVHAGLTAGVLSDLSLISEGKLMYLERVKDIFQWLLYFVIYYRTNLIFVKWLQCQALLCKMGSNDAKNQRTFTATSAKRHWSSRVLLCMMIGGGIILFATVSFSLHELMSFFLWVIMWISGIVIFIKVKVKKVRERIGCLYEIYILYLLWICTIGFSVVTGDKYARVGNLASYTNKHLFALFAVYFVLYLIKKTRGSLNYYNGSESKLIQSISRLGSVSTTNATEEEKKKDDDGDISIVNPREVKLSNFLCKRKHYDAFNKYLALCFCLENMFFVERIVVLRWIIIEKLMSTDEKKGVESAHFYSMKFKFLDEKYQEYNEIIEKVASFDDGRKALLGICLNIYNEFVDDGGMNQINIRHSVRRALDRIFRYNPLRTHERSKSKRISQMVIDTTKRASFMVGRTSRVPMEQNPFHNVDVERFKSYTMFLEIFDDAFKDVWDLLVSVYRMEFAQFLRQSAKSG